MLELRTTLAAAPALRERAADIPVLLGEFLARHDPEGRYRIAEDTLRLRSMLPVFLAIDDGLCDLVTSLPGRLDECAPKPSIGRDPSLVAFLKFPNDRHGTAILAATQ